MFNFDEVIQRRGTKSAKWDARPNVLPLWVADMDFLVPEAITEAIIERAKHGIYGYTLPPAEYYQAIIDWVQRRHGWTIKKEWIVFSPGVVPALATSVKAFSQPGDKVLIQPPVYYPFYSSIENNGRRVVGNSLVYKDDHYSINFEDLAEKASDPRVKVMILCNPHNPVGRVFTEDELRKLSQICLDNNVLLVSDEIHCDLIHKGHKHIPLASLDEKFAANSITCMAPSKTFNLAGLQTSFIIIPDDKIRASFQAANPVSGGNLFGVEAVIAGFTKGEPWLEAVMDYVAGNLQFLKDYAAEHIPGMKVIEPEGTYLVWVDCSKVTKDPKHLDDLILNKAKVWLDDGCMFGPGGECFQRINLACPRSILEEALEKMAEVLN